MPRYSSRPEVRAAGDQKRKPGNSPQDKTEKPKKKRTTQVKNEFLQSSAALLPLRLCVEKNFWHRLTPDSRIKIKVPRDPRPIPRKRLQIHANALFRLLEILVSDIEIQEINEPRRFCFIGHV